MNKSKEIKEINDESITANLKRKRVLRNMYIFAGVIVAIGFILSGLAWGGIIPTSL